MLFVRHGFSCANVSHVSDSTNVLHHKHYLDPPLANTGIRDSKKMRKIASSLDVDVVCCSAMNRAIETALIMFPRHAVFVVPHVKEIASKGADNDCDSLTNKMAFFKKEYPKDHARIYYGFVNDKNIHSSDFPKFKKFMRAHFSHVKKENVAVVTHSKYMIKHLKITFNTFPNNNCVHRYEKNKSTEIHPGIPVKPRGLRWSRCAKQQSG